MSDTLNSGDYAALRGEVKNKQISSLVLGTLGAVLLGVAAMGIMAAGGWAAVPVLTAMGPTGAGMLAAVAGVLGIGASWKAVQNDIELQMDFDELRARRNAATLSQAMGGRDNLTPQQAAVVATTMAANQEPNYPQNQRADGRQWGDVVGKVADAAIVADVATNVAAMTR